MTKKYSKPAHFRDALKSRLKRRARQRNLLYNRYRQRVLFERFAARVYQAYGDLAVLKGGLALELRVQQARMTKDIDIRLEGNLDEQLDKIRHAASKVGDDYLRFEVAEEKELTEMVGDQIVYEGRRVDVEARLAGSRFGEPFHIDISVADALVVAPETKTGDDVLTFIGIAPLAHKIYPQEAHVAEKLHAWSLPRDKPNSRVKDFIDIGLLAANEQFEFDALHQPVEATFTFRDTHPTPQSIPECPPSWETQFEKIRDRDRLKWSSFDELKSLVSRFIEPLLDNTVEVATNWSPEREAW